MGGLPRVWVSEFELHYLGNILHALFFVLPERKHYHPAPGLLGVGHSSSEFGPCSPLGSLALWRFVIWVYHCSIDEGRFSYSVRDRDRERKVGRSVGCLPAGAVARRRKRNIY